MIHIFIPTRGRLLNQTTMDTFFLQKVNELTEHLITFVVADCEADEFAKTYSWVDLLVVSDSFKMGKISQTILDYGRTKYKAILDDDLELRRRRNPNDVSQKNSIVSLVDATDCFDRMETWLDKGYAHGGFSMRQSNHYCRDDWKQENSRACGLLFFNNIILAKEQLRFDKIQEHQNFHIILSLLELGYYNIVDYEFMIGQITNAPGGCSIYRTYEYMKNQAELLSELHSGASVSYKQYVNGVTKDNVKTISGIDGVPNTRIAWKKSFGIRSSERKISDKQLEKMNVMVS